MKKQIIRLVALCLCLVSLIPMSAVSASAATKVSSYDCSYSSTSGGGSRFFYVKTGDTTKSRQITLSMGTGTISAFNSETSRMKTATVYGSYEIKVYYKDSNGKWVLEQDYDVYNKSSATITCKREETVYKIQIYSWRVSTIFNSYWNKNIKTKTLSKKFQSIFEADSASEFVNHIWGIVPSCKAKPRSGCTMYNSCP